MSRLDTRFNNFTPASQVKWHFRWHKRWTWMDNCTQCSLCPTLPSMCMTRTVATTTIIRQCFITMRTLGSVLLLYNFSCYLRGAKLSKIELAWCKVGIVSQWRTWPTLMFVMFVIQTLLEWNWFGRNSIWNNLSHTQGSGIYNEMFICIEIFFNQISFNQISKIFKLYKF